MHRNSYRGLGDCSCKRQKGAALIVGLVVLAIVTVLGVTSMQSSNTELKLAASMRDRAIAFEAAEAALAVVESQLNSNPPSRANLLTGCNGTSCFNPTCNNGLCFSGNYDASDDQIYCEVADGSGAVQNAEFWSDSSLNVWQDTSKHKVVAVDSVTTNVKYITEFLCFVDKRLDLPFTVADGERNNGAPLFRITVLAEGNNGRSSVALQSTYKLLNGI